MTLPDRPSTSPRADRPTALAVVLVRALDLVARSPSFGRDADLVQLVEVDPVLRGAVLRIVRGPLFGAAVPEVSLAAALERLGPELLTDAFRSTAPHAVYDDDLLTARCRTWLHGIAVAAAARWLSNQGAYQDPEEAYLAGLAHAVCHGVEHPDATWTGSAPDDLRDLRFGPRVDAVVRLSSHFGRTIDETDVVLDGAPPDPGARALFEVVARADVLVDALGFGVDPPPATPPEEGDAAAVAEAVQLELAHAAGLVGMSAMPVGDLVRELAVRERRAREGLAGPLGLRASQDLRVVSVAQANEGLVALRSLTSIQEILERGVAQLHGCLTFDRIVVLEREHGKQHSARVRAVACRTRASGGGARSFVEIPVPETGGLALALDGDHPELSSADDAPTLRFLGARSFAAAPLRAGSASVGALLGDHFVKQREVTNAELAALAVAAATLGLVLENAALHAEGKTLRALAEKDALTGINNRRNVLEILRREIDRARRYGKPLSIALIDVDHFKTWNDLHGHQVGDLVLQTVAQLLSSVSREIDACGRYGGEEFLVVLPETAADHAAHYAERLRATIAAHGADLAAAYPKASLSVSVGVTQLLPRGDDADQMIQRADGALYAAKAHGRNRVCVEWPHGERTVPAPAARPA